MKICMKEMSKNEKGITIISLVITIIVMIIIATISINMGLSSINSTQDSAIETNLEIVQQAITQQYSKAMTLNNLDIESNINSNGGTGNDKNQPNSFLGTPLTKEEIKKYIEKLPQAPDLINVDNTYNYDDTNYEDIYYLISDNELEELGIDIGSGQEYIVNYSTGEVLDVTNRSYANGDPAYINSFTTILDVEKEDFVDTPINIAIHEEMKRTHEGYEFSIKVTDEIAKITPDGIADGKIPTQSDIEKDTDDLNKNDVITENIVIIGKDPNDPITDGVSIVKKVVPDSSQGIGEHYIYEFIIDESKVDPTNPTIKIEILPDSVIDDGENGNALAELTTSDNRENEPGDIDFYLDNIKYYAKNEKGEQISGVTLGDEVWGSSATVDITLSTTEKRGLNNDSYIFNYVWSTTDTPNWEDAKQFSLNPRQGVKSVKTTITIEGYTGKGKLYVKPSTQFETAIGTEVDPNCIKSIDLNLDCTPPSYKVEYKAADGTWRPLEEYLKDPNGYFIMSEPERYGNISSIEVSPALKVTTMDYDAGLPQETVSNDRIYGNYAYGIHAEEDLEKILYKAKNGEIIDVSKVAYYSECFEAGSIPMEVKNGKVHELVNELDFLALHNEKPEDSGEYILVCSKKWGYDGAYFIDCLGNKLEGNVLYNNLKIDYCAPKISKIELFEEGYGEFSITDDYSGIKLDKTKIKYSWIGESSVPSNVQWKTITDEQIKQKQQQTAGGAYKKINFKVDLPEEPANYYLAVKLDNLEDIAGNKINTEMVSEENVMKELFDFTLENLEYEIENNSSVTSGGFKLGDETWGQTASVDIVLKATGKKGLKAKTTYTFEYYWTTDENYNWDTPENELNTATIFVNTEGNESQSQKIYLTDYTGAGYLYVRPSGDYESALGTKLSKDSKRIKVNLDNKAPEIEVYYKDNDGKEKPIEEFINKKDSFLNFQTRDPLGMFSYSSPNITYSFIDKESGLASDDREAFWSSHLFFDENHNPREIYGIYLDSEYSPTKWFVTSHSYQREDGYIIEDNVFKLYKNFHLVYSPDIPSGEYNLALTTLPRLLKEKTYLSDNCGNMINDIYIVGPIKIDTKAPEIVEIISDEYGNPMIQINDDYSGLSKDYTKIKYAWVKSKTETPTTWINDFSDIIEEDHTDLNAPKTIYAKPELPTSYKDVYLAVKIEGYEDVAGNKAESDIVVSEETFGFASDLEIEIFEDEGLEELKEVQIKITSKTGKFFKIASISYEHIGLNDNQTIVAGDLEVTNEYLTNYYSTVNGPIIVYVKDINGNEYEKEYTVKNVQGLILEYDISESELYLPLFQGNVLCYIDWDKEISNDEANYITKGSFDIDLVNKNGVIVMDFNIIPEGEGPTHNYTSPGKKKIEITGMNADPFSYYIIDYVESVAYGQVFWKPTVEADNKINDFMMKMEKSRLSLIEIIQFGPMLKNSSSTTLIETFYGCENLTKLPQVEDFENDYNVDFLENIEELNYTFAKTGISEIDSNLFYKAENLEVMKYTFEGCKSLKTIVNGTPFKNCENLKEFLHVFENTALEDIPYNLFESNEKLTDVSGAFSNTKITSIPENLFVKNTALQTASATFSNTKITSIPENLFVENTNLSNISRIFSATSITGVSNKLFEPLINCLTNCSYVFYACPNLKLEENSNIGLFKDFKAVTDFSYIFCACYNINIIPQDIFSGCSQVKSFASSFELTAIPSVERNVIFGDDDVACKNSVTNVSRMFSQCANLKEVDNLFESFSKLGKAEGLFAFCPNLTTVSSDIFKGCTGIVDIGGMFCNCSNLTNLGKNIFDKSLDTIKLLSFYSMEYKEDSGVRYKRKRWYGIFENCEKLVEEQTPELYHIPIFIEENATIYNSFYDVYNYNTYVNVGFDLDFEGAIYHEEEWEAY